MVIEKWLTKYRLISEKMANYFSTFYVGRALFGLGDSYSSFWFTVSFTLAIHPSLMGLTFCLN